MTNTNKIQTKNCKDLITNNSRDIATRRSCGDNCNSYIRPLSKQMNMASHTIRQRANPHCQTRVIIQNVDCNSKCEPFHFDDANNANRTTPFPTRSNREYLQDKLELRRNITGNTLSKDCNCIDTNNTTRPLDPNGNLKSTPVNLRTQHIQKRNTKYYKDSAVSGASRIDMLKNLMKNKGHRNGSNCCNPNSIKDKEVCCKQTVKRGCIRFRR